MFNSYELGFVQSYVRVFYVWTALSHTIHCTDHTMMIDTQDRISDCFMKNTDRYLNEDALRYLGMKVLNLDTADDLDNKPGTHQTTAGSVRS